MTQARKGIEEYAVECSTLKVWLGMLDYVVAKFVRFTPVTAWSKSTLPNALIATRASPHLRRHDEINRMIITGFVLKRAIRGNWRCFPPSNA